MKHLLYTMLIAAAALTASCSTEKEGTNNYSDEYGSVHISIAASADVEDQTRATVELPEAALPKAEAFSLRITGTYNDDMGQPQIYDKSWATISLYDSPMMRRSDEYKAVISFGDMTAEGAKAACFHGEQEFSIMARRTVTAEINASLSNAAFKVAFDTWFNNYYADARITIRTESNNTFTFTNTSTDVIFVKPGTKLFLSGSAVKSQTGVAVEFHEVEIGTTATRTQHTVKIKASEAGGSGLTILLDDEFTEVAEHVVELNPEA